VVLILALPGLILFGACSTLPSKVEAKAAIVDQLYDLQPNEAFIVQITRYLEDYGFKVDLYQGEDITVDFYRKLQTRGYQLIIFRVHSGLLQVGRDRVINKTWLFTSEPYSPTRYVSEQLTDQVAQAAINKYSPLVFAINAKFITESMEGTFKDTAIIMMGCSCFHFSDLAEAFVQKGASTYVAWDRSVLLGYVDEATVALVEKLCLEGLTIGEAVARTMKEKGPDPQHGSVLKYYPLASAQKTLKQLIK
jgi:hypothetical protein